MHALMSILFYTLYYLCHGHYCRQLRLRTSSEVPDAVFIDVSRAAFLTGDVLVFAFLVSLLRLQSPVRAGTHGVLAVCIAESWTGVCNGAVTNDGSVLGFAGVLGFRSARDAAVGVCGIVVLVGGEGVAYVRDTIKACAVLSVWMLVFFQAGDGDRLLDHNIAWISIGNTHGQELGQRGQLDAPNKTHQILNLFY